MKVFGASLLVSAALATLGSVSQVEAHSWLTKPVSREHDADGADLDNSMACPSDTPGKVTSFKAGETIDVRYWRNNHIGGFIRWSIVPKGKETKANLDKSENIFHYSCRESGPECVPKGASNQKDMYADDGGDENTISCGDKITLPDWLPAGEYVLQWTWFGVGSDYGNVGWEESMFRSCADIKLTTAGSKSAAPKCPTFTGGDRVTKMKSMGNDKCFYFYRTEIANSQFKGSNDAYEQYYKFGLPTAVAKCGGGTANSTAPASVPPSPVSTPVASTKAPSPTRTSRPTMIRTPAPTPSDAEDSGDGNSANGDSGDDNGDDSETGNEGEDTGSENSENGGESENDGDNEDDGDKDTDDGDKDADDGDKGADESDGDNEDDGDADEGDGDNEDDGDDDWWSHGKRGKSAHKRGDKH